MSGEQWGEAVDAWIDAAAEPIWDYSNPEYPIRDGDAWQECRDLARQTLEAAAPLIVADTRRKVAEERERDEALCRAVERELIIAMLQRRIAAMDDRKFKHGAEWALAQIRGKHAAIARDSGNGDSSGQEGT